MSHSVYISKLKHKHLLVLYGYFKSSTEAPVDIIDLCLKWLMDKDVDVWDLKLSLQPERIQEIDNIVTGQLYQSSELYASVPKITTAVASMIVSINTDIKIWKLKCIATGQSYWSFNFVVGLISFNQIQNEFKLFTQSRKDNEQKELFRYGYTLDLYSGKFKSAVSQPPISKIWNDLTIFEGDDISIRYKTITRRIRDDGNIKGYIHKKVGVLSFRLNYGKWVRGFSDIPVDNNETYKLALQLRNDETIKLIN